MEVKADNWENKTIFARFIQNNPMGFLKLFY